jgi:hypothetical protein
LRTGMSGEREELFARSWVPRRQNKGVFYPDRHILLDTWHIPIGLLSHSIHSSSLVSTRVWFPVANWQSAITGTQISLSLTLCPFSSSFPPPQVLKPRDLVFRCELCKSQPRSWNIGMWFSAMSFGSPPWNLRIWFFGSEIWSPKPGP